MRGRSRAIPLLASTALLVAGCAASPSPPPSPPPSSQVRFEPVALPAGATPEALAADGDTLLVGVRRAETGPGLLRQAPDGTTTEITVSPSTPYGRTAYWYSVTAAGDRILGIGGDRGGAHGNVRWSVWSGSAAGVGEQTQAFSTFGGWGAGDLTGAILTPAGPALVGSWQSAGAGFDVAVWTPDGDTWNRRSSAGTPLESTVEALGFVTGATVAGQGILVVGWEIAAGRGHGQAPVVWRSDVGATGWTRTALPDAGTAGAAVAARCDGAVCVVAGRVDGALALWRSTPGGWTRVTGVPQVAVGDSEMLSAPLVDGDRIVEIVPDGGAISIVKVGGGSATIRPAAGPAGVVHAVVEVGGSVYVLAGPDDASLSLWRAAAAAVN